MFPGVSRRFAGIALDVVFDYYLTRHWSAFSSWSRAEFISGVYASLSAHQSELPQAFRDLAPRWIAADWLRVYETRDGVAAVLNRVAQRMSRPMPVDLLLSVCDAREKEIEKGFLCIFADVQQSLDALGYKETHS